MGEIRSDIPGVKLFCGLILGDPAFAERSVAGLRRLFGPTDLVSGLLPFDRTSYYEPEMGPGLKRLFVSFRKLISRDRIAGIKIATNRLERRLSGRTAGRKVNLDPGYLTEANVCLATTKDWQHRVYVGRGIFVENTLRFRRGQWADWEWTYPDYRSSEYKKWFSLVREAYRGQLKG